jgi:hypothetical protein
MEAMMGKQKAAVLPDPVCEERRSEEVVSK